MNTKVLLAAVAGAIATFLSGWLIYGMLLKGYFDSSLTEGARSISRGDHPIIWAIFLGGFAWALLLAMIFDRWANIRTWQGGGMAGAWIGFLIAIGANLFSYAQADWASMNALLLDACVNIVQGAISGAVSGFVLGYGNK